MPFTKRIKYNHFNYRIFELVENEKKVLDVGCATGKLLECLKISKNCQVFGMEVDEDMADEANKRCENIIRADVESCEELPFEKGSFDIIIFADVLEHLKRPDIVLRKTIPYLKDGGYFLFSIPNVAFLTVRLGLLFGKFVYTEYGVLDKTHLCFFTLKTARKLIEESGLKITHLEGYNQVRLRYFILKPLGKIFKSIFATDFVIRAVINKRSAQ
jgi:methionine biosynthesis protein MetW